MEWVKNESVDKCRMSVERMWKGGKDVEKYGRCVEKYVEKGVVIKCGIVGKRGIWVWLVGKVVEKGEKRGLRG